MKRLAGLLVVTLCLSLSPQPLPAADKDAKPDYFPLTVGSKWSYKVDVDGNAGNVQNEIVKIEKIDGQDLARLEASAQGKVVASEHLATSDKGIFRHRFNGVEIAPPLCLLKYPVKAGETWDATLKIGGENAKVSCRVDQEMPEVKVPAGKYKTVVVHIDTDLSGQKFTTTFWFSDGVGFVKQEFDLGVKGVLELEKFEPGKAEGK